MSNKKTNKYDILLESAVQIFAEKGFHQTKIKDITDNASLAAGTFYIYFKNKDALLEELLKKYFEQLFEIFENIHTSKSNAKEKIENIIMSHVSFLNANKYLFQVFIEHIHSGKSFNPFVKCCTYKEKYFDMRKKYFDMIEEIIIQGQNENLFSHNIHPVITARALLGMVIFTVMNILIIEENKEVNLEELSNNISHIFIKGIQI